MIIDKTCMYRYLNLDINYYKILNSSLWRAKKLNDLHLLVFYTSNNWTNRFRYFYNYNLSQFTVQLRDNSGRIYGQRQLINQLRNGLWLFYISPESRKSQKADVQGFYDNKGMKSGSWTHHNQKIGLHLKAPFANNLMHTKCIYFEAINFIVARAKSTTERSCKMVCIWPSTPTAIYDSWVRTGSESPLYKIHLITL